MLTPAEIDELFEHTNNVKAFEDEIEAVATGSKPMSVLGWPRTSIDHEDGYDDEYRELLGRVLDHGLLLINHLRRPGALDVDVFIVRTDQIWRVPAYIELKKSFLGHRWTDGSEALESTLLGYPPEAISRWLSLINSTQATWQMPTMYILLSEEQVTLLRDHGMRCVPHQLLGEGTQVFITGDYKPLRADAPSRAGKLICRVAISRQFADSVFPRLGGGYSVAAIISEQHRKALNNALDSRFELFESGQWT